jgi:hypothetical protein
MENSNLQRVGLNLGQAIEIFWRARLESVGGGRRFTANQLRQYVNHHNFGTAPGSADRVMRDLKKKKKINYALVNRAKSLYEALPLE